MMEKFRVFSAPPVILSGPGSATQVGRQARLLGAQRALLVSDATLAKIGLADKVVNLLAGAGLTVDLFDEVEPEPFVDMATRCGEVARQGSYELVVGLGGGSAIDVAKTAALLVKNRDALERYFGVDMVRRAGLPTILMPTTSGTGSEVTPNIVLTKSDGKKAGIVSPYVVASAAIVDPEMVLSAPPSVTAASGVDALTHAIEAYLSTKATPLTDW